ncbi:hypothetical protein BLFGPEAP_01497 [Candidatus Methanoperedenaceae archaeon GB50]|nr:hypothetical protein BLFGPEAP_01497 [Candidatus Methanoperedenaceae archaeon GB50]
MNIKQKRSLKNSLFLVPEGRLANTVDEVKQAVNELGLPIVIKAQIQAGGRGKGRWGKIGKDIRRGRKYCPRIIR